MLKMNFGNEKGGMLIVAVVLSFSLFIMGLGFLTSVNTYQKYMSTDISFIQAFYAAKAKLSLSLREIRYGTLDFPSFFHS